MRFAANLSLLFTPDVCFKERCARVASQGFQYVELLFPYYQPINTYAESLEEHGLQIVLVNTPIRPNEFGLAALPGQQTQFQSDFKWAVDTAQTLGAKSIHIMAGKTFNLPTEQWEQTLCQNLEWALNYVQGKNITLLLEPLNHYDVPGYAYSLPDQLRPILDHFQSEQLRLQFDFYHTLKEKLPLVDTLRIMWPYIDHIQFADPYGRHEPNLTEHPEIIHALYELQALSYSGFLGCEYHPTTDFESSLHFLQSLQHIGLCTNPKGVACI